MAQEVNVLMGLSVKAMIFHEGKLLLLQKNDAEGLHHWEFPGGGLRFTEDFEAGLSPWRLRPVSGAIRRKTASS